MINTSPAHEHVTVPNVVVKMYFIEERTAIVSLRIYLGFTQEKVAQKLNISQATYARMEQAKNPRQATRKRIAEALGLDESQLIF